LVQRALSSRRQERLKRLLGGPKYAKVVAAGKEEMFDQLDDQTLQRYKQMQNTLFDEMLSQPVEQGGKLQSALGMGDKANTATEILGAAVETGESAGEVAASMPGWANSLGGAVKGMAGGDVLAGADKGLETGSGAISGMKDTFEGGRSMLKQKKYFEGGMGVVSGVAGIAPVLEYVPSIAAMVPGLPDAAGLVSAGAKTVGGVTKVVNAWTNHNAVLRLKADSSAIQAMQAACDVLIDKISYLEGMKQTAQGALEGGGSLYGGYTKWAATLLSKGAESAYNLSAYTGRAIASTLTSRVDSNAKVNAREEMNKQENKAIIAEAVKASVRSPNLIGRLRRLCVLIDPDLAEAVDGAVANLNDPPKQAVLNAIKAKDTWNPE